MLLWRSSCFYRRNLFQTAANLSDLSLGRRDLLVALPYSVVTSDQITMLVEKIEKIFSQVTYYLASSPLISIRDYF